MFPAPIAGQPAKENTYRMALLISLTVWLLPIMAVALTSLRSMEDLNRGNIWNLPSHPRFVENYADVLTNSAMHKFILNSFLITVPSVIGTLSLSAMAAFVLAKIKFRGRVVLLAVFIAGNLAPFQVLMIPVRQLTIDTLGIYDTHLA
jgi:multiple sugar transport system permease protein